MLRFVMLPTLCGGRVRIFGATMTSASGAILANAVVDGNVGINEEIVKLAVAVGDR